MKETHILVLYRNLYADETAAVISVTGNAVNVKEIKDFITKYNDKHENTGKYYSYDTLLTILKNRFKQYTFKDEIVYVYVGNMHF